MAWLSAHQSIGVPQPLKLFGTHEQKKKYLPRLAKGAISAFALTEPGVGSDPAKMETTAVKSPDGKGWILNGEKLWCTNGTKAELLVVMARTRAEDRQRQREEADHGVHRRDELARRRDRASLPVHGPARHRQRRCIKFDNVFVPNENLLWGEGLGLKLALITLNTGRLTIPAGCAAAGRKMLDIAKEWANERVQWGAPIGKHEAVAAKIAWMASHTFAMEAIVWLTSGLADRGNVDLRLEAAMAKLFNTEVAWQIVDHLVQIRGGRGYETARSLRARGEKAYPGRADHARHAHQPHLRRDERDPASLHRPRGGRSAHEARLQDPAAGDADGREAQRRGEGRRALRRPGIRRATSAGRASRSSASSESSPGTWATSSATSRHLSRSIFHAMMRFQAKLERKQMVLFRIVDIGTDLFAMAAAISYATMLAKKGGAEKKNAIDLADVFCREARMRIDANFHNLFTDHDDAAYKLVMHLLKGEFDWFKGQVVEPVMPTAGAGGRGDGEAGVGRSVAARIAAARLDRAQRAA